MYSSTLSLTSALDGDGCSTPGPGRFTLGKDPVPIAGWAPGPVWTGAENIASIGIRSPDRPAQGKSVCRLPYTGPHNTSWRKYSQWFSKNFILTNRPQYPSHYSDSVVLRSIEHASPKSDIYIWTRILLTLLTKWIRIPWRLLLKGWNMYECNSVNKYISVLVGL
jgi:hypothetical protein